MKHSKEYRYGIKASLFILCIRSCHAAAGADFITEGSILIHDHGQWCMTSSVGGQNGVFRSIVAFVVKMLNVVVTVTTVLKA